MQIGVRALFTEKKKGHKVKRRGSGEIGYRCRRSGDGIVRKLIKI